MVIPKMFKMDLMFSRCFILASIIGMTSASPCEILNTESKCNYVVKCERLAASVANPNCDGEPNVTFIITKSNVNYLNPGYFSATNFDSRVRTIKCTNNEWTKIDTTAFRYYSKCVHMDLSDNKIEKISAEAFRPLINLKYLNLSRNKIDSLYLKSFCISDSRNSDLQELDLSNNKLEYLGSELNELPQLRILYLQNNRLSRIADTAFMNLENLSHLYMQNNLMTSVNLSLIHLKSLTVLDVSNNHLTKLSGYEVNRLVALAFLNISHNELTSVDSNCFNQAFNLQSVDFSFNDIKMNIESIMFINNNKLNYLNFYSNKIAALHDNVFQFCNLNYLNLDKNNISGDITDKTLCNLRNITALDLSNQRINGIKNNAFSDMENLRNLNLSKNIIKIVENKSFINTSITILDLSHNNIPNLYFLKDCLTSLTELYVNNNNITILSKYILYNQTQLRKLDLAMNNIIRIDEFSLPLLNLQYLNILGNRINGIIKRNIFSSAKYLRFLDLNNFNITNIDSLAFENLPVLAKLNISNNFIKTVDVNSFKCVDNLYSLDVSFNKISDFMLNISVLANLKALYLSHNNITTTSRLFTGASKLTYLDLSHNHIQNLSKIGADILPNLTVLYLDNNKIIQFNNPTTNSLTSLIDLRLSSNNITEIKISYFKDLMSVDLSNNNLNYLNSTLLEKNEFLQALDVSRNKIIDLPPGTFQFMKNLKLLNLSSNYLTRLRYGSLKGLHKTEILDLSKNNIAHLDVDIFYECDELKTLLIDYNRITTFDVERLILVALKKLRTLSLGGNPILCNEIVRNIKSVNTTFYAIRQVEVTSIDKIYHEDNVHGIKCGDYSDPMVTTTTALPSTESNISIEKSGNPVVSTVVVLVWCSILTIIIIACAILVYFKLYKKRVLVVNRSMSLNLGNSINLTESDYHSDMLI